jgi:hypothetical protein
MCFALIGLVLGTALTTSAPASGTKEERATIKDIIYDSIGWALTKDLERLKSLFAHDEDFFMFQPTWDATVAGWEEFTESFDFFMDPRFVATHFDVRDFRLNLSPSGDVAWFSAILDDCYEWDGRPGCWKDTRWTGVLEKRGGEWVIVQMHFSHASDKVLAEAKEKESSEQGEE